MPPKLHNSLASLFPEGDIPLISQVSSSSGILDNTLRCRLKKGVTSFVDLVRPVRRSKFLPSDETRTLSQVAIDTGILRTTLEGRLQRGVPWEVATLGPKRLPRSSVVERYHIRGDRTLKGIAAESDVSYSTLLGRLHAGWSLEKALSAPARRTRPIGKFSSHMALAKKVGISRERVRQLVNRGETVEAILSGSYKKRGGRRKKTPKPTPEKGIRDMRCRKEGSLSTSKEPTVLDSGEHAEFVTTQGYEV